MARGVHPKKEVRRAVGTLQAAGWTIEVSVRGRGHRWATAMCPNQHPSNSGPPSRCVRVIHGTPRNEGDHAKQLLAALRKCEAMMARSQRRGHPDD